MFDPIKLAERFAHDAVTDAEVVLKHADVKDALIAAATAILPGVDLPQEAEEVVDLLRAAGEIVHRAIDRKASPSPDAAAPGSPSVSPSPDAVSAAGAGDPPAPPAGFEQAPGAGA